MASSGGARPRARAASASRHEAARPRGRPRTDRPAPRERARARPRPVATESTRKPRSRAPVDAGEPERRLPDPRLALEHEPGRRLHWTVKEGVHRAEFLLSSEDIPCHRGRTDCGSSNRRSHDGRYHVNGVPRVPPSPVSGSTGTLPALNAALHPVQHLSYLRIGMMHPCLSHMQIVRRRARRDSWTPLPYSFARSMTWNNAPKPLTSTRLC